MDRATIISTNASNAKKVVDSTSSIQSNNEIKKSLSSNDNLLLSKLKLPIVAVHDPSTSAPLQAVSISKSQRMAAVACGSYVKVLSLDINKDINELYSLQLRTPGNFTITDVSWTSLEENELLAVSATNGAITVFSVEGGQKKALKHWETTEISRAVNRIDWHPIDRGILAAACQDGAVRTYDCREKSKAAQTIYSTRADAARDVKFDKFHEHVFSVISENGTLSVWDMRKSDTAKIKIASAHTSCGLSIAWHPFREWVVATGSRDKTCKIWDLNTVYGDETVSIPKPTNVLHTAGAVAKIAWRPCLPYQNQLATTSSADRDVSVWDLDQPNVPICILRGHEDAVTDFVWLDTPSLSFPSTAVSSSKSNKIVKGGEWGFYSVYQHILTASKDSRVLVQDLRGGFFPRQHMASSVTAISSKGHVAFQRGDITRTDSWGLLPNSETKSPLEYFNHVAFNNTTSINQYSSTSSSVRGKTRSPVKEKTIHVINKIENDFDFYEISKHFSKVSLQVNEAKDISSSSNDDTHVSKDDQNFVDETGTVYVGLADISDLNQSQKIRSKRGAEAGAFDPAMVCLLAKSYSLGDVSIITDNSTNKKNPVLLACEQNLQVATASGLRDKAAIWATVLTLLPNDPLTIPPSSDSSITAVPSFDGVPFTIELLGSILKELLENGDCQHFVVLCELLQRTGLLRESLKSANISDIRRQEGYISYLDILAKLQLFCAANSIIKASDSENISRLSMQGVVMHTACSRCNKELPDNVSSSWCVKCKNNASLCMLCQRPVRGLMQWCPVCAHGGHLDCAKLWFKLYETCPSGCGHNCCSQLLHS